MFFWIRFRIRMRGNCHHERKAMTRRSFNCSDGIKFQIRENVETRLNSVKSGQIGIQNGKTEPRYKISTWIFVYIFIDNCSFIFVLVLGNSKMEHHGKRFFFVFSIFKMFIICTFRDDNLIATLHIHYLVKTNWLYIFARYNQFFPPCSERTAHRILTGTS